MFMIANNYIENEFQEFMINAEGRILKMNLIDNWGPGGGNFILVKRMIFEVADIIGF